MQHVKITIPSLMENIRIVESFIDNSKERFHFDDDIYGNIMVAVTESVNNAIRHGNKFDKDKNVHLRLAVEPAQLRFEIEDEGTGFDYEHLPDPTAPENLENPGGRGIFLMQALADEVAFFDNGRRVQLLFRIPTAGSAVA
jgi:serine/threonine-protein kinase RsbW